MASYKSKRFFSPAFAPGDGCAALNDDKVSLTALALNDTVEFRVEAGQRVSIIEIQSDDLDSNGTPLLAWKIGYKPINAGSSLVANDSYFGTGLQIGRAAGRTALSFKPITFDEPVSLVMTCTAAAATFAAGDIVAVVGSASVGVR